MPGCAGSEEFRFLSLPLKQNLEVLWSMTAMGIVSFCSELKSKINVISLKVLAGFV